MSYSDLMLTKAVALRRLEQQEIMGDPYARPVPTRVYRRRALPSWLRRVQYGVAGRLVSWGESLQAYNTPPVTRARRSSTADCFETVQVRR